MEIKMKGGKKHMDVKREPLEEVKRLLRQEAGFGCCICGCPFYEYHHIREFSLEPHHNPEDMMVLCPNHHHQATINALEESEQRRWKQSPSNKERGFVDGQLIIGSKAIVVELGNNLFIGNGFKLVVDTEPLLQINTDENGRLLVSVELYDNADSSLISVIRNEWISGDPFPWDISYGCRWIKLRNKQRDIALFIDARQQPVQLTGNLWRKGQCFSIGQRSLLFNGVIQDIGMSHLGFAGLILSANTVTKEFQIVPDPVLKKGKFFNWPDETTRVEYALTQYDNLLSEIK